MTFKIENTEEYAAAEFHSSEIRQLGKTADGPVLVCADPTRIELGK